MTVDVVLAHHYRDREKGKDYLPGDRLTVDEQTARDLVAAGQAKPATQADAKEASVTKR